MERVPISWKNPLTTNAFEDQKISWRQWKNHKLPTNHDLKLHHAAMLAPGWGCDDESPCCYGYEDEIRGKQVKIHRYSRFIRFKFVLYDLVGSGFRVPNRVVRMVKFSMVYWHTSRRKIWNTVRQILCLRKLGKYYNNIPEIIFRIKGWRVGGVDESTVLPKLLEDFQKLSWDFDNSSFKKKWKIEYFLNLRFVALSMMHLGGFQFPYYVPLLQTSSKKTKLAEIFWDLVDFTERRQAKNFRREELYKRKKSLRK